MPRKKETKKTLIKKARKVCKAEKVRFLEVTREHDGIYVRYLCNLCQKEHVSRMHRLKKGRRHCRFKAVVPFSIKALCNNAGCEFIKEDKEEQCIYFICQCGQKTKKNIPAFKSVQKCQKCTGYKGRFSYEEVRDFFEQHKAELLETEYINKRTLMTYKCSCGNIHQKNFGSFKLTPYCHLCLGRYR